MNPIGPGGMVTTGVGTDTFTWGDGTAFGSPSSSLHFEGAAFNTEPETPFLLGTLVYFNGTIADGTMADAVTLRVALAITAPTGVSHNFDYVLHLINTPNTADPLASADYVNLPSLFPSTIFSLDGVNYTLGFSFGNSGPGGFTEVSQFHVLEGATASAQLQGVITTDLSGVVPEPGTYVLLTSGLSGLFILARRRR